MRRFVAGLCTVVGVLIMSSLPSTALAKHLLAPTGVSCHKMDETIEVSWTAVTEMSEAQKYSVKVIAGYDVVDADGVPDTFKEFDFGTSDRTDGEPINATFLIIALSALVVDVNDDLVLDSPDPDTIMVAVKALDPGKGKGRQNHAFSFPTELCL